MKNTFLKRFSSLQNEKHIFEAFSYLQNERKQVFEAFWYLQNEKHINFWSVVQVYKAKNTFSSIFTSTTWKTTSFWSVFQVWKNKKHVFEAFQDYKIKKDVFEEFSSLQNEKNTLLNRFSLLQHENAHFWSDCEFFHWARNRIRVSAPFSVFTQKKNPKIELLCYLKTLPP